MERKYEAILCLFPLEIVLTGPVEELAEDRLEVGGKLECLGLGKPRAFLAVGRLGGRYPTKSNQFLIMASHKIHTTSLTGIDSALSTSIAGSVVITADPTLEGGSTGVNIPELLKRRT